MQYIYEEPTDNAQVHIDWCKKWKLKVNANKTNAVHFRNNNSFLNLMEFHLISLTNILAIFY